MCIAECPSNQVWNECGSPCNKTCEEPDPMCIEVCKPRCECPEHSPIWRDDWYMCISNMNCKSKYDFKTFTLKANQSFTIEIIMKID